jgi:hypothetical protein
VRVVRVVTKFLTTSLPQRLVPALAEIKEIQLAAYLTGCGPVSDWSDEWLVAALALHPGGLEKIQGCTLSYQLTDVWVDEGLLKHAYTLVSLTDLTVPYNTTMTHVTRLTRLRELSIIRAHDHQVTAFAQLTSLRRLDLVHYAGVGKDDFALLCRNNPSLAHLTLNGCSNLDDDSLFALGTICAVSGVPCVVRVVTLMKRLSVFSGPLW